MKWFSYVVLFIWIVGCDEKEPILKRSIIKHKKCQDSTWSRDDSTVIQLTYLALMYMVDYEPEKAIILYKHACTLPHELPEIYMYTGLLSESLGDTVAARNYYLQEMEHDLKLLRSTHFPNNRKDIFIMSLVDCYYLLSEKDRAAFLLKCPEFSRYESYRYPRAVYWIQLLCCY